MGGVGILSSLFPCASELLGARMGKMHLTVRGVIDWWVELGSQVFMGWPGWVTRLWLVVITCSWQDNPVLYPCMAQYAIQGSVVSLAISLS
jgi:hypothetical protein